MEKTGLKLTDLEDSKLVEMALKDDSQEAFFLLYARYHKSLKGHISKYVQEDDEIEDICMESFEKAFKQLATYKPENRFSTWLFRIARNTAFDHKSKEKTRGQKVENTPIDYSTLEAVDIPAEMVSPEEEIISSQDHENFLTCLDGLPQLYRDIAKMAFIDNLGYQEISEKTDLPVNTIKTRISRAKRLITEMMLDKEEEV